MSMLQAQGQKKVLVTENATMALATFVLGIMAGFFYTYSFNVNLAFENLSAENYALTQSLVNQNVRHFGFFLFFFGGVLFPLISVMANARHWKSKPVLLMVMAAVVYFIGIVVLTRQVNLPLNAYTEGWDLANIPADWEVTRDAWNAANAWRSAASALAFLLALFALTLRATTASNAQVPIS